VGKEDYTHGILHFQFHRNAQSVIHVQDDEPVEAVEEEDDMLIRAVIDGNAENEASVRRAEHVPSDNRTQHETSEA
jgi:hypothetical protein